MKGLASVGSTAGRRGRKSGRLVQAKRKRKLPKPVADMVPEKDVSGTGTLTDDLTNRIRRDILTARLSPDMRLRIHSMKATYNASVGTLREALSRLAADSLVEVQSQRGFRVASASVEELVDIFRCLKLVEVEALRESIAAGDDEWEIGVLAAHHRMVKVEARQEMSRNDAQLQREWERLHIAFHQALISACGSSWLLHFCKLLRERALRYRHLADVPPAQHPLLTADHIPIMQASVDRDVARATDLLVRHFDQTAEILRGAWDSKESRRSRALSSVA